MGLVSFTTWVTRKRIRHASCSSNKSNHTNEVLVLGPRGKEGITRAVTWEQSRGFSHSVVVGSPHELDCVTDSCVNGEGDIAQDTLGGSDNDSMSSPCPIASSIGSGWQVTSSSRTVLRNTF